MQQLIRRLIVFLSLASTLGLIPQKAKATHLAGADITYTCLGGNTYRIDLTFYRDCAGTTAPPGVILDFQSVSCNLFFTQELEQVTNSGQEITYPCPGLSTSCDDPTSSVPGLQQYHYSGIVVFPMQCADWQIRWNYCCRNCDITTIQLSTPCIPQMNPGMSISANLDNLNYTCNNSPTFTNIPIVFVCVGQNFTYNHGALDPDGDSLAYTLVDPLTQNQTPVTWLPGYSATNPISSTPALTLDPITGDIVMTPTAQEVGLLSILVEEFRNGVLIGHVVRDMEIYVRACNNILPTATGMDGTASHDTTICPGTPLCFEVFSNDSDANQIVTMTWNSGISGATYTISGFPYPTGQFCWTPTVADISASAHQFTVTVVDNACPNSGYQTYSFNILVNSPLMNINVTNISCNGLTDGAISVSPVTPGGYTYTWGGNASGQTTPTIINLGPGSYPVTIFDSTTGCTATFPNTITDPPPISDSTFVITASCPGSSTGEAAVIVSGGTPPYTYTWNTSPPTLNDTITGVPGGVYTVIITDTNGCTKTDSVNVNFSSGALSISVDSVSALDCFTDTTGIAAVSVSGGTPGYTYVWNTSPPQNGPVATGLSPGIYIVTVTDTLGCSSSDSVTVASPPIISLVGGAVPANCNLSDGAAFVTTSGGVPPYTYVWQGFPSVDDTLPNVPPGLYHVTTTDSNGCIMELDVLVGSTVISSTATGIAPVGCSGDSNAVAIATASGGIPPYSYSWNTVPPQLNDTAFGLSAGLYIVTITDSTTCYTVDTVIILNPPVMTVNVATVNSSCNGSGTGSATAHVTGGVSPFTYVWTSSAGTDSVEANLAPGNYDVTVTDAAGCSATVNFNIAQDTVITITVDTTFRPSCFGAADGAINITVTGGSGVYTYSWNGGNFVTEDLTGVGAGNYTIVATDQSGCTQSDTILLANPPPVPAFAGQDTAICAGTSIQLSADPLTTGLTGTWSGPAGVVFSDPTDPNATVSNMPGGFATLTWTVTDGTCTGTDNVSIFGFNFSAGADADVCGLGPVQLQGTIIPGFTGVWTGSPNIIFNDPTLDTATATSTAYGAEILSWTVSGTACSSADDVLITFYEMPVADAGDSETVCINGVQLHAVVSGAGYGIWSERFPTTAVFADSSNENTEVSNLATGITVFVWTMMNGVCQAEDTVMINFDEDCELELPTGFSPNGDTYNDGYEIKGIEAYPVNIFKVFNRWGNEVYSKTNYGDRDWVGQNKSGDELPEGTYYVILQVPSRNITKNTFVDLRKYSGNKK